MRILILLVAGITLAGCAQSAFKQFYYPFETPLDFEPIDDGQPPQVFGTDDYERDMLILLSKKYVVVGYSSFNGGLEETKKAAAQAKIVGANIVLVHSAYTNTLTTTSTLFLPDNKTTYHSGSVRTKTSYSGGYSGKSSTTGRYSGTSTTYGSKAVPVTSYQRRYDQSAMYFARSNREYKFGVLFSNLTPEQRAQFERNAGVLINVVIEDSPAFNSNVLAGDLLIAVDGAAVKNKQDADRLMGSVPLSQGQSTLKVIRNGSEKQIRVQF